MRTAVSPVKEIMLREIERELTGSPYAFISNFENFPLEALAELRRSLGKVSTRSLVVKHTLARKAFANLSLGEIDSYLKGHVLITFGEGAPQTISKAIVDFAKKNEKFVPRAVVFEKKLYDQQFIKSLALLPSRQELLTQVVVRMKSPISGFVMTLNQVLRGFAVALNEIKKKKEGAAS